MLLTDSEKARLTFYNEITSAAADASSEELQLAAARFEHKVIKRVETEIGVDFKKGLIIAVTFIFIASVFAMWTALYLIFNTEVDLIRSKFISTSDRIIDSKVAVTLIGATVVQIAVAFGIMTKNLFGSVAGNAESGRV
jgi:hypothetical protein